MMVQVPQAIKSKRYFFVLAAASILLSAYEIYSLHKQDLSNSQFYEKTAVQDKAFPKVIVIEVEGRQTFAAKSLSRDSIDLLGQEWKVDLKSKKPTIKIDQSVYLVQFVTPSKIKLKKLTPGMTE
jgi:hypothetical protein